jgi:hypothetical protein
MMLTCSVCGKMYAIRSGLVKRDLSINNFLVSNNFNRFGKVEYHELRIEEPRLYDWNCIVRAKILSFEETGPNFRDLLEFPIDSRVLSSFIFE